jgi:hypothetical protein
MKETEVTEIDKYSDASAIPRNEIIRRATIAYVRIKTGKTKAKDIESAFKEVGGMLNGQLVKGVDAAVAHLHSAARETPKDLAGKIPNSQTEAVQPLKNLLMERKANPHQTYGVMTGYGMFDSSTGGIRKKQLYLHAGYGGHLKSTMMLNMVLNAAVDGGWNPIVFSSEMPQAELMFSLVAMHSANPIFATTHPPLNLFRLLLGQISDEEEKFYDMVHDHLVNDSNHGVIRIIDVSEFTSFGSVQQRIIREHAKLEVDIAWVDYITRLPLDAKYWKMQYTEGMNLTLADAKRFAMSFDNGNGLALCSPFQVNREGYKKAKLSEGRMDKTALAQYNAAEKEADVITYIFYDEDEAATSEPKVGMMKSRWGQVSYKPVSLFIEPDSRRIFDLSGGMATTSLPVGTGNAADEVVI